MVEALDDGLDGSFGRQCSVLADGGEIDEGQPGDSVIVVADNRHVTGNVNAGPDEGVQDAMGASVVRREDSGRQELIPAFERYGLQLDIEAHPYDFSERNDDAVQIIRGLNRPRINYCYCVPHAFHLSDYAGDMRTMIQYASAKLTHIHVADCYNHRANAGNRVHRQPARRGCPGAPAQRDRQR